jgi:hypothetical protein
MTEKIFQILFGDFRPLFFNNSRIVNCKGLIFKSLWRVFAKRELHVASIHEGSGHFCVSSLFFEQFLVMMKSSQITGDRFIKETHGENHDTYTTNI